MKLILNADRFFDPEPVCSENSKEALFGGEEALWCGQRLDIPLRTDYTRNLYALLNKYGNERDSTTIA